MCPSVCMQAGLTEKLLFLQISPLSFCISSTYGTGNIRSPRSREIYANIIHIIMCSDCFFSQRTWFDDVNSTYPRDDLQSYCQKSNRLLISKDHSFQRNGGLHLCSLPVMFPLICLFVTTGSTSSRSISTFVMCHM